MRAALPPVEYTAEGCAAAAATVAKGACTHNHNRSMNQMEGRKEGREREDDGDDEMGVAKKNRQIITWRSLQPYQAGQRTHHRTRSVQRRCPWRRNTQRLPPARFVVKREQISRWRRSKGSKEGKEEGAHLAEPMVACERAACAGGGSMPRERKTWVPRTTRSRLVL